MLEKLNLGKIKIVTTDDLQIDISGGKIDLNAVKMEQEPMIKGVGYYLSSEKLYYTFKMNGVNLELSMEDISYLFNHIIKNMDTELYLLKDKIRIFEILTTKYTMKEMKEDYKSSLEFKVLVNEMYNVFEKNERYEYLSTINEIKKK